jgi:hypothetical protein
MNTLFTILVTVTVLFAGWKVDTIGPCPTLFSYDVEIAKGRNDDTNRLYVSTRNGGIYEWTYRASRWNVTTVKTGVVNIANITVGDGRGDNVKRLYFSEFRDTGDLYEATWNTNSWNVTRIDTSVRSLNIFTGRARSDSVSRLYVGNAQTGLWEYSYNGGVWNKTRICADGGEGNGVIGNLRNDGVVRIASNGRRMSELTWSGIKFDSLSIDTTTLWPDPLLCGDLRGDGVNRILANSNKGRIEFVYSSGSWVRTVIDPTVQRGDILIAKLKVDGVSRAYSNFTAQGTTKPAGPVKEYRWNGTYHSNNVIDAVSGATASLAVGTGRNDKVVRLYAPHYSTGKIYEITNDTPFVEQISGVEEIRNRTPSDLQLLSSRILTGKRLFFTYSSSTKASAVIVSIQGKKLLSIPLESGTNKECVVHLDKIGAGVVFLRLTNGSDLFSKKLIF